MAHVDEISDIRVDFLGGFDGHFEGHVGGVGGPAQGINDEDVAAVGGLDCVFGDGLAVCVVSEQFFLVGSEDVAGGGHLAVWEWDGCDFEVCDFEGAVNEVWQGADVGGVAEFAGEGVLEDAGEVVECALAGEDGHV